MSSAPTNKCRLCLMVNDAEFLKTAEGMSHQEFAARNYLAGVCESAAIGARILSETMCKEHQQMFLEHGMTVVGAIVDIMGDAGGSSLKERLRPVPAGKIDKNAN